ncbi:hypothetical protein TREMEDRAFT_68214 [Tremella mesenterica DSM 1558]|uniref:uncharacterized protein n=1 Tax=Tremella mesenterica (strain ATCC 24925 / CBS 8224 / DSM 1558 / NBRC 9311 / NRRL Y-6157 / RJB 2259-6 / UBC 559-6) TaxID=578456 RepID=UPI0003F48E56|nr:uncharacterized protein TREMEDRAFT_68214 [Tremella mesenterica DSM 1558]EIW70776.1 hypothetical protein TREMEDRAFT_68214 [Tremella mesenterica DSM 1558]
MHSSPRSTPSPSKTTNDADIVMEDSPHAPYRPPEAVFEPPEEHPPGYVPGVVAEHIGTGDDEQVVLWDSKAEAKLTDLWDADEEPLPFSIPDRPVIGAGLLPRRLLMLVHEHELVLPVIEDLPKPIPRRQSMPPAVQPDLIRFPEDEKPATSPTTQTSSTPSSTSESQPTSTLNDVYDALPGGVDHNREWYFCAVCWGWVHIVSGRGHLPAIDDMDVWSLQADKTSTYTDDPTYEQRYSARVEEQSRLRNLLSCNHLEKTPGEHHFHEFHHLLQPSTSSVQVPRIPVDSEMCAFPHLTPGLEPEESWQVYRSPRKQSKLYVSCTSDLWILVDAGPVPGQIPVGLVEAFTLEKVNNPRPGMDMYESVNKAWGLIVTLLENPLFKGQRGWVKLENKKFQAEIGANISSSALLYQIGFACREELEGIRVGPFQKNDKVSEEDVRQMDRYMLRTWVEISLYLQAYQTRNNARPLWLSRPSVHSFSTDVQAHQTVVRSTTESVPDALNSLGVTKFDTAATIIKAYNLQILDDPRPSPLYLNALELLSRTSIPDRDTLELKVGIERSMGAYTASDIQGAYARIGYDQAHAASIEVEAHDAPDEYILDMHKKTMQASSSASDRAEISAALVLIGRERRSENIQQIGRGGQTFISVEDAYSALSAPRDCIDDGLVMQYEMAVAEFPGKADHYRKCLEVIASAPGEERPSIRTFLETGSKDFSGPARKDIPVGLHNIGNTCYLNSILQYLYSIKPIRDAVMEFEQDLLGTTTPPKPEVERSRRFVRHLRLLFIQLYLSEASAVRPEEELAYLAITRPEVDQIIEPPAPTRDAFSGINDIPSPSSTKVATPEYSPSRTDLSLPSSPVATPTREQSILGKRQSTDRDSDGGISPGARPRLKSDDYEMESPTDANHSMDTARNLSPDSGPIQRGSSPSMTARILSLDIKSPPEDSLDVVLPNSNITSSPTNILVPPPLPPRPRRESTLASGLKFGLQQDSAEVLINVLSQLESAFEPPVAKDGTKGTNLIQQLYSCKYRQQIIFQTPEGVKEAREPVEGVFVHPIIGVEEEGKDLSDCLAELYLGGSDIEYEGKKGAMMDLMDEFPPMLYIQMRRSQFDLATGRERKTNTHIPFGQTLSMDRFLATADRQAREASIVLTQEMMNVRHRLHQLRNHKVSCVDLIFPLVSNSFLYARPLSIPSTFLHVHITPDLLHALTSESDEVKREISQLELKLPEMRKELDEIWKGKTEWEYELMSVFMHRGKTSGAGHYWTYQSHLPDHQDKFFKYNDELVTQVPSSEVLQDRTGSDANPALLCYVRKNKNLVDTLHRAILEVGLKEETPELVEPME